MTRSVGENLVKLDALLSTLQLDALGDVRAAIARSLAWKMDQVLVSESAQAAMAAPGISKELREVLDAIQDASDDSTAFVSDLFAAVGNTANA